MVAIEFQSQVVDGRIEIPPAVREQVSGEVDVIVFARGAHRDPSPWPDQNRRRWELIAKKVRQGLTDAEAQELATLQEQADQQLAHVGPRPFADLERLYAELTEQD